MTTMRRIELAEQQVSDMQKALSAVQAGLERVDSVVGAAEAMKDRSERTARFTLVLVGLAILLALWSLKKDHAEE